MKDIEVVDSCFQTTVANAYEDPGEIWNSMVTPMPWADLKSTFRSAFDSLANVDVKHYEKDINIDPNCLSRE
jgi:hypothetical protein